MLLTALAGLRPAVDRYFDDVLVMADDEAVRLNRLRLLDGIAARCGPSPTWSVCRDDPGPGPGFGRAREVS